MATVGKGLVQKILERAHAPEAASQIFTDKIQYRQLLLRPTSPPPDEAEGGAGLDGRDARRRSRRLKQELQRDRRRQLKPKPLSARERRRLGLYDMPVGQEKDKTENKEKKQKKQKKHKLHGQSYATFIPLHRLWLGYICELLGPQELRCGGQGAAAKLTAADFHGAEVEVTRSACSGRVGTRGIVVRDTRFVFEIVTPDNHVKMVPKEGTFFRIEIPVDEAQTALDQQKAKLVFEIIGSQFLHRATDRANRKFKQHFYKEL
ncbi:ribonuclease p complex subunit [Grosmannia clavigera kw1407]|uniref:Ribonuclease P protein subunit n=1 Tax=Grosmannia clavigera (strain kw1407 / UAMH 11150) TaxID=655863 RepID=F0XSZ0_GROCL|nr:ribonuclease p complex subunit [Grosmannia clavigera kw1407]EFW99157.1 ribonuclease p complex subunit [Grosmannia clavigera kw1407]